MNQETRTPTEAQKRILDILQKNFGLSDVELERVLFLNERDINEPWIPADLQEAIARQIGGFSHISVTHDKYIAEREQVIYTATVIDTAERSFTRSGSAIVGETPNNFEIDTDNLAASRALNLALNAAGFNPFKAGAVVTIAEIRRSLQSKTLNESEQKLQQITDESISRQKDLGRIHLLAEEKGLWIGNDGSRYRQELYKNYGTKSAATLNRTERAAVINWLENFTDEDYLKALPVELRNEAMIA